MTRRTVKKPKARKKQPWPAQLWGVSEGYRSGLEKANQDHLKRLGISYGYESRKIPFVEPEKKRSYTPDFFLKNGIIVETKGRFLSADRRKHLLVQEQHPDLEIRFVFSRGASPIYKGSKTTNAKWAEKHGFMWAEKLIPEVWMMEPTNPVWLSAIMILWQVKRGVFHAKNPTGNSTFGCTCNSHECSSF